MFPCPGCGAPIKFNIELQRMKCDFCESTYDPDDVTKETLTTENSEEEKAFFETTIFTCPQCGGEMMGDDTDITSFCSYCGAPNVLNTRISKEERPQCIIPFKITKKQCVDNFRAEIKRNFFAPKAMADEAVVDSFRGIYTPYYSYRISQRRSLSLTSKKSHRSGDYIITDTYQHTGDLKAGYAGIAFDASTVFYDDISEQVGPYDIKDVKNFNPAYLSGFYADLPDADPALYVNEARDIANYNTAKEIEDVFGKEATSGLNQDMLNSRFGTVVDNIDTMFYPTWFMSYRYKDRLAYATINGQDGTVVTDIPVDNKKFVLFSLLLAVPIFVIMSFILPTIGPSLVLEIVVCISATIMILMRSQNKLEDIKTNFTQDKAMRKMINPELTRKEIDEITESKHRKKIRKKEKSSVFGDVFSWLIILIVAVPWVVAILSAALPLVIVLAPIIVGIICAISSSKFNDNKAMILDIVMAIVGAIAGGVVLIDPPADSIYYGMSLVLLVIMLMSMFHVLGGINKMSLRPLPQFKKKGGDDDAKI